MPVGLSSCKRPHRTGLEDEAKDALETETLVAGDEAAAASFLDPLTNAPWLGHADDGALVKLEFFAEPGSPMTLCRTTIHHFFGSPTTGKSEFAASSKLTAITWHDGKSRGSYDAEAGVITASIDSKLGKHQVALKQVTVASDPLLATFRKSIPDDDASKALHEKFSERLANGARWWKSVADWEKIVTAQELVAGDSAVLIRPAGKVPIKLPALKPGASFDVPLICHLPPGTTLALADQTVGVMVELQHEDNVRAMWALASLNPGANTQEIQAHWAGGKDDPELTGAATLYIYLCKSGADNQTAETNRPVSNLLKIELEIGAAGSAEPAE